MTRFRQALDRHRPAFVVALLLLGAALLPAGPGNLRARIAGLATPLSLLRGPATEAGAATDAAASRRLQEEVAWLQARVRTLEAENEGLREVRALRLDAKVPGIRVAAARVAGKDLQWPLRRTVLLDRGTADGIRRGLPVIAGRCLVGFVVEAGPRSARVQLLDDPAPRADDPKSRAAVRVFRPGNAAPTSDGVLSGEGRGWTRVRMLPKGAVAPGDLGVTCGADPLVPEGLLVGRVHAVEEDGDPKLAAAHVVPAADLAGLREVFVLVTPEAAPKPPRKGPR